MKKVVLPEGLHRRAKAQAAKSGLSLSLLAALILERGLDKLEEGSAGFQLEEQERVGGYALHFKEQEGVSKS